MQQHDDMTPEEFKTDSAQDEKLTALLMHAIQEHDGAKQFLNSTVGLALRKFIVDTKEAAMLKSIEAVDDLDVQREAQFEYAVTCEVERFFAEVVTSGRQALEQMKLRQEQL